MSKSLPRKTRMLHFLGGFLGWFLLVSLFPFIITACPQDALGCLGLIVPLYFCAILLTLAPIIFLFLRRKWITLGIVTALAVNFLVLILFGQSFSLEGVTLVRLGIPFFFAPFLP